MAFNRSSMLMFWILISIFPLGQAMASNTFYAELANEDMGIFQAVGDTFLGDDDSDGNYSQGFYLSYTMDWNTGQKLSFNIEHDSFTPDSANKNQGRAVIGDRPFAGFLGIGGKYIRRDNNWVQRFGGKLGVVGSNAKGEQVQDFSHESAGGMNGYSGWNDQVKNRYGIIVNYFATWRLQKTFGDIQVEFSSHGALVTGNFIAYEGIGTAFRIGNHLDQDYGHSPFSMLSGGEYLTDYVGFSWSVFMDIEMRHMRRNYILEGRTSLTNLQTVDMNNEVTDKRVGADIKWKRVTLSMTFVERSPEFSNQNKQQFLRIGLGIDF